MKYLETLRRYDKMDEYEKPVAKEVYRDLIAPYDFVCESLATFITMNIAELNGTITGQKLIADYELYREQKRETEKCLGILPK